MMTDIFASASFKFWGISGYFGVLMAHFFPLSFCLCLCPSLFFSPLSPSDYGLSVPLYSYKQRALKAHTQQTISVQEERLPSSLRKSMTPKMCLQNFSPKKLYHTGYMEPSLSLYCFLCFCVLLSLFPLSQFAQMTPNKSSLCL